MSNSKLSVKEVFEFLAKTAMHSELGQLRRKMVMFHDDQWHGACNCGDEYAMQFHAEQSNVWAKFNDFSFYYKDSQ